MDSTKPLAEVLLAEGLIPVGDLPRFLPPTCSGKLLARSAVWRWISKGLPGPDGRRVHLEAIRVGRRWVTSVAAVARLFAKATGGPAPMRPQAVTAQAPLLGSSAATLAAHGFDVSTFGGSSS
jgi:hypothetical protein